MRPPLRIYQYLGPLVLTPTSLFLWWREYSEPAMVMAIWVIPILWAYIVPGVGTNLCKVWEFDVAWKLGKFRPHHGFVFGSATSMLAWAVHSNVAHTLSDMLRYAFILCSVLGFWNILYEVKALKIGLLKVYNQPWAKGHGAEAIALDYSPWFFGGFGAAYGAYIAALELYLPKKSNIGFMEMLAIVCLGLLWSIALPVCGFIRHSMVTHGHPGTRPLEKDSQ